MKAILLALLFAGLLVQNQGMKEQDDADDMELKKKADQEATGKSRRPWSSGFSLKQTSILIRKLQRKIDAFPQSEAKTRAINLFGKLKTNWDNQTLSERRRRRNAVKAVVNNLDFIRNSVRGRSNAYIALVNLMVTLGPLKSKTGIRGKAAMFTTSCMALFGEAAELFSDVMSLIVLDIFLVMDKYPPRSPIGPIGNKTLIAGAYYAFKLDLNGKGVRGPFKITSHSVSNLKSSMSKFILKTDPAIDKLHDHIIQIRGNNDATDAKRFLAYVELYVKLETVREMLLYHALSLVHSRRNQRFITSIINKIRRIKKKSRECAGPVYSHSIKSKFMAYYDDEKDRVLTAYMVKRLKWPKRKPFYDNWLFPDLSCIGTTTHDYNLTSNYSIWKFFQSPGIDHPYFSNHGGRPCKWRVVNHGFGLYSIVNKNGCPDGRWCNALLSFDNEINSNGFPMSIVSIKHDEPVLWEFKRRSRGYIIEPKRFCRKMCEKRCHLGYQYLNPYKPTRIVGIIECRVNASPHVWSIYSAKSSDMVTESGSAATNQSSVNQEDNTASGEEDDGVSNFSDENENEILEKSKQETDESESNQDSTENDIED